jgi:hypothetical protein
MLVTLDTKERIAMSNLLHHIHVANETFRHKCSEYKVVYMESLGILQLLSKYLGKNAFSMPKLGDKLKIPSEPFTPKRKKEWIESLIFMWYTLHTTFAKLTANPKYEELMLLTRYEPKTQLYDAINTLLHHLQTLEDHFASADLTHTHLNPIVPPRPFTNVNGHALHVSPPNNDSRYFEFYEPKAGHGQR